MGIFKNWLSQNEVTLGSDGLRDNTPTQTAQANNAVAQKWMANPKNAKDQANLFGLGKFHKSALDKPLIAAGADAIKGAGSLANKGLDAPAVSFQIQNAMKLPPILKQPK